MRSWQVQDAKARFNEPLDLCQTEGPQIVMTRGAETAVLVPIAKWRRLQEAGRPTLKDMLLAGHPRGNFAIPERRKLQSREPEDLD